jgi:hypothetical protein
LKRWTSRLENTDFRGPEHRLVRASARRRRLVEGEREVSHHLTALRLACIDDDAQSESTEVVWRAEIDAAILEDEGWQGVARDGTDEPAVFAAYLKTLRWGTATAADRVLFQAPFRAGRISYFRYARHSAYRA